MKNKGKYLIRICILFVIIFVLMHLSIFSGDKRPFKVDDLFTIEQLHNIAISPDFNSLAVVIKRAKKDKETYKKDYLEGNDRGDIWLVPSQGGEPQNITNGSTDGSGYWNPVWSPDGKRIALLSTKGGDNARLYVYDIYQRDLKRLTSQGVDLECMTNSGGDRYLRSDYWLEWFHNPYLWISDNKLLCPIVPEGDQSKWFKSEIETPRIAMEEWPKVRKGTIPTVSVLEIGNDISDEERPKGRLLLIDVAKGKLVEIDEGNFRHIILSPNKKYAGLVVDIGANHPDPNKPLRRSFKRRSKLGILSLENDISIRWLDVPLDPIIGFLEVLHAWAPDSSSIAVIARADEDEESAGTLFLINPKNGEAQRMTNHDIRVSSLYWSSPNELLVYASLNKRENLANNNRMDWLLIDTSKPLEYRNITAEMKSVPSELVSSGSGNMLLGVAGGDLWSIDIRNDSIQNLTDFFEQKIGSIIWPKLTDPTPIVTNELVVQAKSRHQMHLFKIDAKSSPIRIVPFPKPSSRALLANFILEKKMAIFAAAESDGTFLWTGDGVSNQFTKRISLNEHLGQIADAEYMKIEYRGIEGDKLKALLILPVGYESGKKYPMITVVYAGAVYDDWTSMPNKNNPSFLNYNLLSSNGYIVLFPSMPMPSEFPLDPFIEIPKGVMPAVDEVIEMGIADSSKLGLIGHSFGGYSTYSLITFTNRFKAAVSMAGISNMTSLYGIFQGRRRYGSYPHEDLFAPRWCEYSQPGMDDTLWGNLWRYIRNSPIYYLDRVATPIMIIHADLDPIPIEQGEEFFTGLYRLGKRATFVRYWGESHTIESPANIRDMWGRLISWFDENFKMERAEKTK